MNQLKQLQKKLQSLLQNLLSKRVSRRLRASENEVRERQNQEQPNLSHSPNLLQNLLQIKKLENKEKREYFISRGALVLIIGIQLLFIFLSLYNARTVVLTKNLQTEIRGLEANVNSKKLAEEKVRDVITRTNFLKAREAERVGFSPKIENFINGLPSSVTLVKSNVLNEKMTMTIETQTPLEISLLISNYFERDFAQEVIIRSAIFNQTENIFVTTLELVF